MKLKLVNQGYKGGIRAVDNSYFNTATRTLIKTY